MQAIGRNLCNLHIYISNLRMIGVDHISHLENIKILGRLGPLLRSKFLDLCVGKCVILKENACRSAFVHHILPGLDVGLATSLVAWTKIR